MMNKFPKVWRPIHPLLHKLDHGSVKDRLLTLRDTCKGKSPAEIHMLFDPDAIGKAAELQFSRGTNIIEGLRNASIFAPLMLMLISLGLASQAYIQSPQPAPSANGTAFFNEWLNGFPAIDSVKIFGQSLSLVSGSANTHWFTFSSVLIADFILLLFVITLTITVQVMEVWTIRRTRSLTIWLNQELEELFAESGVRSLGVGPGSEQPEWAVRVHDAIYHLHQVLQGVEAAVSTSQQEFARTIDHFTDVYQKQNWSVDKLLTGTTEVGKTVDRLGGIYQKLADGSQDLADALPAIGANLTQMVRNQEIMTGHLKRMTDDIYQLAQPFRAVGLAEMARQMERQQKENLSLLSSMQRGPSRIGRLWRKVFS